MTASSPAVALADALNRAGALTGEKLARVLVWARAAEDLAVAKEREMQLRLAVVNDNFPDIKAGTTNAPLCDGFKLKVEVKPNYKLDRDMTQLALEDIRKDGEVGEHVAGRLVKFDPVLSVTEYKSLDTKFKVSIDAALTVTNGTPALSLVLPKG